jgi:hypothetical protein
MAFPEAPIRLELGKSDYIKTVTAVDIMFTGSLSSPAGTRVSERFLRRQRSAEVYQSVQV